MPVVRVTPTIRTTTTFPFFIWGRRVGWVKHGANQHRSVKQPTAVGFLCDNKSGLTTFFTSFTLNYDISDTSICGLCTSCWYNSMLKNWFCFTLGTNQQKLVNLATPRMMFDSRADAGKSLGMTVIRARAHLL